MLVDLIQLRTFVAVAEEQHLTRAAERLHISLSAASAHVQAVERTLDQQLFVRTNRRLELTRSGELLLAKAKVVLNEATTFASFASSLHGKLEGQIIIGSDNEPSMSRIGSIVSSLRERNPLLRIDLRARTSRSNRHGLGIGEIDVGLLMEPPTDAHLTYYELTTVPFCVAGPASWREVIEHADYSGLAALPWLAPVDESLAYSEMLREMFGQTSLGFDIIARYDNPILGRAMSSAGVGLMLMRSEHAQYGVSHGALSASPIAKATYPLFLCHLSSRENDPIVKAFVDATSNVWPEMQRCRGS
jgi:DNA-binding transcriptional LysR family regulator